MGGPNELTIKTTEVSGNGILQRACLELSTTLALRRKVLPEQRVIDVTYMRPRNALRLSEHNNSNLRTSAVELERGLKKDLLLRRGCLRKALLSRVQTVHVGLVVLAVVQLHNLARDVRLERVVGVGEVRERVLRACQHGERGAGHARAGDVADGRSEHRHGE